MGRVSYWIKSLPGGTTALRGLRGLLNAGRKPVEQTPFPGSAEYWRERYQFGRDSGLGSYGVLADFKARVLNGFFAQHGVRSVIEFGCGDGNQLGMLEVADYTGIDISPQALALCRERYAGVEGRRFLLADEYSDEQAECALSLDVIYHLVEDETFDAYMRRLFGAAQRFVVVYSSNRLPDDADNTGEHVRHRRFTDWVEAHQPAWTLIQHVPNEHPFRGDYRTGSFADFYFYGRRSA